MTDLTSTQVYGLLQEYEKLRDGIEAQLEAGGLSTEERLAKLVASQELLERMNRLVVICSQLIREEGRAKMAAGLYKGSLQY